MSQFSQLCNKLVKLSNRPDVLEEIKIALRQATIEIHQLDFFHRDLMHGTIVNSRGRQNEVSVPMSNFPRLRAIKSIVPKGCCEELKPNAPLTVCRCENNWWRTNGGNLIINSSFNTNEFDVWFYQNPKISPDEEYSSWVADLYEPALLDWSLMLLFIMLRDSPIASQYAARVGQRDRLPTGHIAVILSEQLEQEIRSY